MKSIKRKAATTATSRRPLQRRVAAFESQGLSQVDELDQIGSCLPRPNAGVGDPSDHDTLRSYDEATWLLQRTSTVAAPAEPTARYRGSFYFSEIPVGLCGLRAPVLLSMAAGYIYSQLCNTSTDLIKARIPYRYVRGTHHGKAEGKHRRWDMRLSAAGQEGMLEQLRQRIWAYERQRLDILLKRWDTESRSCAYTLQDHDPPRALHIIFSDKESLRHVRLRSFADDCHALLRPSDELEAAVREETRSLAHQIEHQLNDIRTHFRNVTPIRKRYTTTA